MLKACHKLFTANQQERRLGFGELATKPNKTRKGELDNTYVGVSKTAFK